MAFIVHSLSRALRPSNLAATCSNMLQHKYSTAAASLPRRNWRTALYAAPQPLSPAEQAPSIGATEKEDDEPTKRHSENFPPVRDPTPENWAAHRAALREQFPDGWRPPRKLSRDAMDGLRSLHALDPDTFTTPVLAMKFRVSPEAVRRILRSRWTPTKDERARMLERERQNRDEWIKEQRVKERLTLLEQQKSQKPGHFGPGGRRGGKSGRGEDRLTLQ